jgi:NTP pyrophosphatase (non-canonical NTP hydrolase)
MDINEYSKLALRTANDLGPTGDLIHATLLITSEGGEIADVIKKHYAYGRPLDTIHLIEEVGDCMWGINLLLKTIGVTWEEVMEVNIAKLAARYPDLCFDDGHSLNRDKVREEAAIRGVL